MFDKINDKILLIFYELGCVIKQSIIFIIFKQIYLFGNNNTVFRDHSIST